MYDIHSKLVPIDDCIIGSNVNICAYTITSAKFLQYFLFKPIDKEKLDFPQTAFKSSKACYAIVGEIFRAFGKTNLTEHSCDGMFTDRYNGKIYILYNCTPYNIQPHTLTSFSDVWLTTMHEIVNTCHVHNRTIAQEVSSFFLNNPIFIYLTNDEEIPLVMYMNDLPKSKADFILTFGPNAVNGFYEFHSCNDDNFPSIRFAIFAGDSVLKTTEDGDAILYVKDYERIIPLTALY